MARSRASSISKSRGRPGSDSRLSFAVTLLDLRRGPVRHKVHQIERRMIMTNTAISRQDETAMSEETFEGRGGLNIFFRSWRPDGKTRGVVVIVPGFNAHSGYYRWVAERFVTSGLAVYAVDLR